MQSQKREFAEILGSELVSVTGGVVAGFFLLSITNQLALIPGLLVILPGFLEMRGNISGTIASRLSSGLFVHALKPEMRKNRIVHGNVTAAFVLVTLISVLLGCIAFGINLALGTENTLVILIVIAAGIISHCIEVPLTVAMTFWLFRHGHDPNNIMGPYVTTSGDIISVLSLIAAVMVFA